MNEVMMYEKTESMAESVFSDFVTFAFLGLSIWFSQSQGGGWWTFFTCCLLLVTLSAKTPWGIKARWVRLRSKKEAVEWAQSLPDDPASEK